jgi:hypothetical protein
MTTRFHITNNAAKTSVSAGTAGMYSILQDLLHNQSKILGCLVQRKEGAKEDRKYDIEY